MKGNGDAQPSNRQWAHATLNVITVKFKDGEIVYELKKSVDVGGKILTRSVFITPLQLQAVARDFGS